MKQIIATTLLVLIAFISLAQESKPYQITQKSEKGTPTFIKFSSSTDVTHELFFDKLKDELKLQPDDKFELVRTTKDKILTHYKYIQKYKGITVFGAEYVIHEKNAVITSANGKFIPNLSINISPTITKDEAIKKATTELKLGNYRWEDKKAENALKEKTKNPKATYYPNPELIIAPINGDYQTGEFRLCWKFNVLGGTKGEAFVVFIDAQDGKLINKISLNNDSDVTGSAATIYNGTQAITCDFDGSTTYSLLETQTRGIAHNQQIWTVNAENDVLPSAGGNVWSTAQTYTSSSSDFTDDKMANAVHWGIEKTYDFYSTFFGRSSYDNQDAPLVSLVHYGINYNNSEWHGIDSVMIFGDGDGTVTYEFCDIDVIGHELTHAVTNYTSNLVYQRESGALNESFSDIMGMGVKYFALGDAYLDWHLFDSSYLLPPHYARSMSSPHDCHQPSTYHGTYWFPTDSINNDAGGVHVNSGVQNYWFYLLSEGGTGTNDFGINYSVSGIGIDSALQIAYFTDISMSSSEGFAEAMDASIQTAELLYGTSSPKVQSVKDAWCAVGIGAGCNAAAGIKEPLNNFSVSIYPNPTSGTLTIATNGEPIAVSIYNCEGREIMQKQLTGAKTTINISDISSGLYFVKASQRENIFCKKIIVQ